MNLNLLAHGIYLLTTFIVVIRVGRICFTHGNQFIIHLVPDNHDMCSRINRLLLLGYYLMNLGLVAISLIFWNTIFSLQQLFELLAVRIGLTLIIIAIMHYLNLFWLVNFLKKLINN